eukprot:EG_transcript_3262
MTAGMFDDHDPTLEDPAVYQYKRMGDSKQQDFRRAASWSGHDVKIHSSSTGIVFEGEPALLELEAFPARAVSMVVNPKDLLIDDADDVSYASENQEGWDQWNQNQGSRRVSTASGDWFHSPPSPYRDSVEEAFSNVRWAGDGRTGLSVMLDVQQQHDAAQLQALLSQHQSQPFQSPMHYTSVLQGQQNQQLLQLQQQQVQLQLQQLQQQQQQYLQDLTPLQRRMRFKSQGRGVHFEDQQPEWQGNPKVMEPAAIPIPTAFVQRPVVPAQHLQQLQQLQQQQQQLDLIHLHQQQQQLQQLQQQQQQLRQQQQQQQQLQRQPLNFQVQALAPQQFILQVPEPLQMQPRTAARVTVPTPVQYIHQQEPLGGLHGRSPSPEQQRKDLGHKQSKQLQRIELRQTRAQKSQFPYPLLMTNEWKAFCRDFQPQVPPVSPAAGAQSDCRFLEISLTVDDSVRKSNPVEVVLHGLIQFGPVEIIRTCTNKNVSKWQRRHQRTVLVQMFSAEAAQQVFERGTVEAGHCTMRVCGPPRPAALQLTCDNVCLFAYEVHRLSDADLLQVLKKAVDGVSIAKAKKRVERGLLFDSVEEARLCISVLQRPLLENFNVLLYAYSNGAEDEDALTQHGSE